MAKKRAVRRPTKQKEASLQDAIIEYILVVKKYRCEVRKVHGPVRMQFGGFMQGCGTKGQADLDVYVPAGEGKHYVVHLETKTKTGRQSGEQKAWQREVVNCGEHYFVVRSIEDVDAAFKTVLGKAKGAGA